MTTWGRAEVAWALPFLAVVGLVLGCGAGSGSGDSDSYSRDSTAACLQSAVGPVSTSQADLDFVADKATAGGLHAAVGSTFVTIAFGQTTHDAELTESAYRTVSESLGEPVDEVIVRHGNAVLRWDRPPTDDERTIAEGCLG
jgi:hypothetical protein